VTVGPPRNHEPQDTGQSRRRSRLLPRWFYRIVWALDRGRFAVSGGRMGLHEAGARRLGTLHLRTLGRHSGQERASFLYYLEDGANLAVVASNAGAPTDPAWWLNLQASPDAFVDLPDGVRAVRGRVATATERSRLWARFVALHDRYASYATAAERPIPVVILEPADADVSARTVA
jgi:deazaflavin-dependent oxidoreductase (nitroreductase family)